MKLYQAFIAGLVAFSFAVSADTTSTTTTTTTKTTKAAPVCKGKADASKQVWGKVVSVDAISNTLIITPKGKKTADTISTTDSTVVMPKGTMLADLKADDKVSVSYKLKDGKMVACKITAKPVKKAVAPAAK